MENKFIPEINENDVIRPLFTKSLREHLIEKLKQQQNQTFEKMVEAGWGKTIFGDPNPEYYGDYTHRFWNTFMKYLTPDCKVKERYEFSNVLNMRAVKVEEDEFEIRALNPDLVDHRVYEYFEGFKFKIENYGIDFWKMGRN